MCDTCAITRFVTEDCYFEGLTLPSSGLVFSDSATISEISTDAAASIATSAVMTPGDNFYGTISTENDTDWIRVSLDAGTVYDLTVQGTGSTALSETQMWLRDDSGFQLSYSDDAPGNQIGSAMGFAAIDSGTYYIAVGGFGHITGDYLLQVTPRAEPSLSHYSNDQIADYLREGYWNDRCADKRGFTLDASRSLDVDITDLNAAGQQLAVWALEAWSNVTGITFNQVDESLGANANITFDDNFAGAYASSTTSGYRTISAHVNISSSWLIGSGTTLDSYSFQTYIHEIGHALGLGHSGRYNGNSSFQAYLSGASNTNHYLTDSWQSSVMSYFSQTENPQIRADYAYVFTPMMADILAIQDIYGSSGTIRTGDTTYGYNSTAGGYLDNLTVLNRDITAIVYDEGGTDTLDFGSSTQDQKINLNDETFSDVRGVVGSLGIARGTMIENAISGAGDDVLIGNELDNILTGGGGSDEFQGGAGTDSAVFSGTHASYTISYQAQDRVVHVSQGGMTSIVHSDVENLVFDDQTVTFDSIANINTAPVVEIGDHTLHRGESLLLSSVLAVTDAEGDTITKYELWDSDGEQSFKANGITVDASRGYEVTDLTNVTFHAQTVTGPQRLWVRAHDGAEWGEWDPFIVTTTRPNEAPITHVADQTLLVGQSVLLKSVLTVTDPDAISFPRYALWDSDGDHSFKINGGTIDASRGYEVSSLNNITFHADTTPGSQRLWVRTHDGTEWGEWDPFIVTTTVLNEAPVTQIADQSMYLGDTMQLNSVLTTTDADGDPISKYELWDRDGAHSFKVNGVTVDATHGHEVTDLNNVTFDAEPTVGTQRLWVRAHDGVEWGEWDSFIVTTNCAPALQQPVNDVSTSPNGSSTFHNAMAEPLDWEMNFL